MNQSDDSPFTDLDTETNNESTTLNTWDRFRLARAKRQQAVVNLSLASINFHHYSDALDEVAHATALEDEAFNELRYFF